MAVKIRKVRERRSRRGGVAWKQIPVRGRVAHGDAVRTVVLDAAYRLYVQAGSAGVTMRALAAELHCAPTAIYRYFRSKDALLLALKEVALQVMSQHWATLTETDDPLADLRAHFWRYYEFSKDHPMYFRLLWADASTPAFDPESPPFAALRARTGRQVQRCVDAGVVDKPDDIRAALWSIAHGAAALKTIGMPGLDFDRMAAGGLDFVLAGARSSKPSRPRARRRA